MLKNEETYEKGRTPYLSLTQVVHLSTSHWSRQGARSSQLANLKQIVTERGKKEHYGVTKASFDRRDIC